MFQRASCSHFGSPKPSWRGVQRGTSRGASALARGSLGGGGKGGGRGMITYSKGFPAPLTLVWRLYGASTGRALPFAALATLATGVLHLALHSSARGDGWSHPYTFQTFAYIAGFAVVFRNNFAYQRYSAPPPKLCPFPTPTPFPCALPSLDKPPPPWQWMA